VRGISGLKPKTLITSWPHTQDNCEVITNMDNVSVIGNPGKLGFEYGLRNISRGFIQNENELVFYDLFKALR
jgi:hypothetical protein